MQGKVEYVALFVHIPAELNHILDQMKYLKGVSKSEVVREALEEYLNSKGERPFSLRGL